MYRQHLRMTLSRDIESDSSRSEFVNRLSSIPVVYLAWNIAAEAYHSLKTSNSLLKVSLNTTEQVAYRISNPVLNKLERPLKSADQIACKGLETLQEIVPTIRNQKEKLYKHTKLMYEDTIESGLKKYEEAKTLGSSKVADFVNQGTERLTDFLASPYGEVCEIAFDFALEAGEMYVDYLLPPLGDERPEKLFGDRNKEPALTRVELLKNRLKERLYKHTLLKFQLIRLQTRSIIIKIYHFSLHQYIVETSVEMSGIVFSTVTQVFTNFQDLRSYITGLYRSDEVLSTV